MYIHCRPFIHVYNIVHITPEIDFEIKSLEIILKTMFYFLGIKPVSFEEWENIDNKEKLEGMKTQKPREKMVDIEHMLDTAWHST